MLARKCVYNRILDTEGTDLCTELNALTPRGRENEEGNWASVRRNIQDVNRRDRLRRSPRYGKIHVNYQGRGILKRGGLPLLTVKRQRGGEQGRKDPLDSSKDDAPFKKRREKKGEEVAGKKGTQTQKRKRRHSPLEPILLAKSTNRGGV